MTAKAWRIPFLIGRRGCSLLFLAFLDLVFAHSLMDFHESGQRAPAYDFLATIMPLRVWGLLWLAVGLICLVQAFMVADRIAFSLASALKVGWGLSYASGWLFHGLTGAGVAAVVWLAFGGWVTIISTWPEDLDVTARTGPR